MTVTIRTGRAGEGERTFRYAPLSSGLDIVRKALGQHEKPPCQTIHRGRTTSRGRLWAGQTSPGKGALGVPGSGRQPPSYRELPPRWTQVSDAQCARRVHLLLSGDPRRPRTQRVRCDRRSVPPVHLARGARSHSVRQFMAKAVQGWIAVSVPISATISGLSFHLASPAYAHSCPACVPGRVDEVDRLACLDRTTRDACCASPQLIAGRTLTIPRPPQLSGLGGRPNGRRY